VPKKVGDGNKVDAWLSTQSEETKTEFRQLCAKYYHNITHIHTYLTSRGCQVGVSTLYKWRNANIIAGPQAELLNAVTKDFSGVDPLAVSEALLAKLYAVADQYTQIIDENKEQLTLQHAIMGLPNTVRELRSLTQQIQSTTWHIDFETAVLQGACRLVEIALQTVKDTGEEPFVIKLMEDSMLRVKEELKRVNP
jgi:hypothetical protein